MDEVAAMAEERRPKLLLAGWSAYPRQLDFPRFREIADASARCSSSTWPTSPASSPPACTRARCRTPTSSRRRSTRRSAAPAAGIILCREEYAKKINSAVFPGQQGGPLEHVIAGKAVALRIAAERGLPRAPGAHDRRGAGGRGRELLGAGHGVNVLTGGTDVHLVLVDLRETELDGQQAEDRLHDIGITVNRNAVPFDPRPPMVTSGLRVGAPRSPRAACRPRTSPRSARSSATALTPGFEDRRGELAERVSAVADRYPLYEHLAAAAAA